MKKTIYEKWRLIVAFTMIAFPLLVHSQTQKEVKKNQVSQSNSDFVNNWEKGGAFGDRSPQQELIEKRAKNAKHFKNSDGTFTAQVGGNYHYKDAVGNWQDIDLSIEQGSTPDYKVSSLRM